MLFAVLYTAVLAAVAMPRAIMADGCNYYDNGVNIPGNCVCISEGTGGECCGGANGLPNFCCQNDNLCYLDGLFGNQYALACYCG